MDKKSIIGFILIAGILFGFTFIQNRQQAKFQEENAAAIAAQDSLDRLAAADAAATATAPAEIKAPASVYKDSCLNTASKIADARRVSIENDLLAVEFTTLGGVPYSAKLKNFYNFDSTALYIFKEGNCQYSISVYAGEYIKTDNFNFEIAEKTDSSVTMRLPFRNGAYIEQKYVLEKDSYSLKNYLSFNGMTGIIPRNVSSFDIDFGMTIPRMEKGYKNEVQYSKLDYYFSGDNKPTELGKGRDGNKRIDSKLEWFAFQQQFFSAIMRAPEQFSSGQLDIKFLPQTDPERNLMQCSANMRADLKAGENVVVPFEFYFGPNHYHTLEGYGHKYEKIIPLGGWLVGWFTRFVIIPLFNILHRYIDNFGLIILLMTLIIKTVVLPLTNKSFLSSGKMAALKPEIEKLSAKYPKQEDAMKKQQATMELYKRAGVSPMGGCLPTLLTFPILWAMFRFFPASIELRQQSFLWCHDLSAYDSILDFGARVPLLGDHLSLFALLMAFTMWIYSKLTMSSQPTSGDPNAKMMNVMMLWMMPVMMFFICNGLSAALSYYYLLSQLYSIGQNMVIRKWFIHPEKLYAKLKESEGKPVPKSKWQLRLEEAQKMQEAQRKAQRGR